MPKRLNNISEFSNETLKRVKKFFSRKIDVESIQTLKGEQTLLRSVTVLVSFIYSYILN